MSWHDLWHVGLLVSVLFAGAGGGILVLAPLLFDEVPAGLGRLRPAVGAAVALAVLLIAVEWLGVH